MALKIGTEDKKKVIIAGSLGLVVLILLIKTLLGTFGGGTPAPAVNGVVIQPAAQHTAARVVSVGGSMAGLDPTLHPEIMAAAESLQYTGQGRNIFSMFSTPVAIEKVKAPIRPGSVAQIQAGPPQPPPIDLKFFGYESAPGGGGHKAFLLHGDDVFIASQGDVVDHRYKVLSIQPFSIQVEDLPYNNTQSLPLIQN